MHSRMKTYGKIGAAILLAFMILFFFWRFLYTNSERIISQNTEYISDSANQKSQRVEIIFRDALKNINILSYLYGQTLNKSKVSSSDLKRIADDATFDYLEFADKTGKSTDENGNITDISSRDYFIKGMRGLSNMDAIFDSQHTGGNLIVFASPLRIKGEIVGVLMGLYREEHIADFLHSSYFGAQTPTYLCNRNGQVVAGSSDEPLPENIVTYFDENKGMSQKNINDLKNALTQSTSYAFRFDGSSGPGIAYTTSIIDSDFMLFQSFPSSVTQRMINKADSAGILLTVELILVLLLYIVVILVMDSRQKKKILRENAEMSFVIGGTTKLFDKFILVDLNKEIYRYLAGTYQPSLPIPPSGSYHQLVEFMASMSVNDDEQEIMTELLQIENIRRELGDSNTHLNYEFHMQRNKKHWESLNIVCLARRENVASLALFTRQDVTESKMNELQKNAALKDALEAATAANQAKSDFLSHMSHDIRTPMNAIMGMTAIASMNIDNPEKIKDCLNKIDISNQHLLGLINEVLDMSKIESGKMVLMDEEFSLSDTIENLFNIFHPQIEKKKQHLDIGVINIRHEHVIGDAQRLQQVFVNILGNAVKFTPENGNISISIKEYPTKNIENSLYEFTFTDNGIGMDQSFMKHLFEPFCRATDSRTSHTEGNGLGMSIANNIVQMMNGHIRVKSTPGKGSEFTVSVYLRLCDKDNENMDILNGQSILVVDDEDYACENVCKILNSMGIVSDYAHDGDTAIKKLLEAKENGTAFTAVILDWKMPGKDGLQTAKEIREKIGSDILLILLSSYDWSAVQQEADNSGIDAFIAKPLFKSRLLYVMKNLLGKQVKDTPESVPLTQQLFEGKRVLLVEDNELNMEIAEEILKMAGFTVDTACDGLEAIDKISESDENFYDLILMDIQMPNMNGYEATSAIRAMDRQDAKTLPIIAMSANAFTDDIFEAKKSGMNDHIAKPIEITKLTQTLSAYIK